MLLAVLERRAGIRLGDADVYVSTVGGIKLTEPGADLAIALALASASRDVSFPHTMAAVGEISLAGEIRPASSATQRTSEARRLGFTHLVDSDATHLREALRRAFSIGSSPRERELDAAF
jgi:DNA repair protein RadA/Sms